MNSGETWSQVIKVLPSIAMPNNEFGYSVSIYGTTAIIGSITVAAHGSSILCLPNI